MRLPYLSLMALFTFGVTFVRTDAANGEPDVLLVTDPNPAAAAAHGAAQILAALKEKGVAAEQVDSLEKAHGKSIIVAGLAKGDGPAAKLVMTSKKVMPDALSRLPSASCKTRQNPAG